MIRHRGQASKNSLNTSCPTDALAGKPAARELRRQSEPNRRGQVVRHSELDRDAATKAKNGASDVRIGNLQGISSDSTVTP